MSVGIFVIFVIETGAYMLCLNALGRKTSLHGSAAPYLSRNYIFVINVHIVLMRFYFLFTANRELRQEYSPC